MLQHCVRNITFLEWTFLFTEVIDLKKLQEEEQKRREEEKKKQQQQAEAVQNKDEEKKAVQEAKKKEEERVRQEKEAKEAQIAKENKRKMLKNFKGLVLTYLLFFNANKLGNARMWCKPSLWRFVVYSNASIK